MSELNLQIGFEVFKSKNMNLVQGIVVRVISIQFLPIFQLIFDIIVPWLTRKAFNWSYSSVAMVLIFCVEFWELSQLTRDLSQADRKLNVVTS